jgi:hypothetical protein
MLTEETVSLFERYLGKFLSNYFLSKKVNVVSCLFLIEFFENIYN